MGSNLLLLVVGLVICFGGIYIRKVCSAILGLIWGALCSFAVILMTVGLWGIDDETFIIVAVCAIACALISVIYDKLCAAINAFLSSFFLVTILLLMADSMESATLIIIAAVIALIVSIISVKIYNYSFIIMTAFSGAFIASIGGCGIIYNADASRVFLNLMLGDDVAGFILIGTLVLGVLGCIVQWRRLKGKTANGANTGHKTTVSENTAGAFAPAEKASIQNPFVREIKENWGIAAGTHSCHTVLEPVGQSTVVDSFPINVQLRFSATNIVALYAVNHYSDFKRMGNGNVYCRH